MAIRFTNNKYLYTAMANFKLSNIDHLGTVVVVADTGSTYSSITFMHLLRLLEMSFDEFRRKYKDFANTPFVEDSVMADGSHVKTKLTCLPNFIIRRGDNILRIPEFYCKVTIDINSLKDLANNASIKQNDKCPIMLLGNNFNMAFDSVNFYKDYASVHGFDLDYYYKLSDVYGDAKYTIF